MDKTDDAQRQSPWAAAAARRLAAGERAEPSPPTLVGLAPPETVTASEPAQSAPQPASTLYDSDSRPYDLDDSEETTHVYDDPLAALMGPRAKSGEAETQSLDAEWEAPAAAAHEAEWQAPAQPAAETAWQPTAQASIETPVPSSVYEEAAAAVEPPIWAQPVWAQPAEETPLAVPNLAVAPAAAPAPRAEEPISVPAIPLDNDDIVSLAHAPTLDSLLGDRVPRREARNQTPHAGTAPEAENARYVEPRRPAATLLPAPSEPNASRASVTLLGLSPDHQAFAYPAGSMPYTEAASPRSLTASDAPWSEATVVRLPPRPRSKVWPLLLAFAASLAVTVVVIVMFLLPKTGSVLVTAAGPGGAPIAAARVFFDTKPICEQVPCWISGIHEGQHFVRVEAKGYFKTKDQAVEVKAGEDVPVAVELARDVPPPKAGIEIKSNVADLRVSIDGMDMGLAPLTVRDLEPSEHTVRLTSPLYAPFEQSLRLSADQVAIIEPKLKPLQTVLNLLPGQGGDIVLVQVSGDGELKRFRALPVRMDVKPGKLYRVTAIRKGYQDFRAEVVIDGTQAQKDIVIDLRKTGTGGVQPDPNILLEEQPVGAATGAPGSLTLHSTPNVNVLVDGRPQGSTPRQVQVQPGSHSVVFVHPEFGRKSFNVNVQPGKSASVMAKF